MLQVAGRPQPGTGGLHLSNARNAAVTTGARFLRKLRAHRGRRTSRELQARGLRWPLGLLQKGARSLLPGEVSAMFKGELGATRVSCRNQGDVDMWRVVGSAGTRPCTWRVSRSKHYGPRYQTPKPT